MSVDTTTAARIPPARDPAAPRPFWLRGDFEPFLATLSAATDAAGTSVLLCPPFGWEEMSSFGPRRTWAERLADAGFPALRLDLPGQGDAGGAPDAPDRVAAWVDAIGVAAAWMRAQPGCRRVVAIGLSLGGLLALEAAAGGAAIDDFVLWATPPRGKLLTRELRAFGQMEQGRLQPDDQALLAGAVPAGAVAAGGYLMSAGTREAVDALDVARLTLPEGGGRAALLLERDGIAPHADLVEGLRGLGVEVEVAPGRGYGRMLTEPQFARMADPVVQRTVAWVRRRDDVPGGARGADSVPVARDRAELTAPDGTAIVERVVEYAGPDGRIVGILTERPGGGPPPAVAVLLGGTGHRIGPNRLWVEVARRWAARGVPSLRVDVASAGDASGPVPPDVPSLYQPERVEEVRWLLQRVGADSGAPRVVCVGLCAGAYWALHASLGAGRLPVVPLMINLPSLMWDRSVHVERAAARYRELLFRRETWRRLRGGDITVGNVPRVLAFRVLDGLRRALRLSRGARAARSPWEVLEALQDRGIGPWFFFSGREVLHEQLMRDGVLGDATRWPALRVDVVPGQSDLHTLRPLWLQRLLHERIDAALAPHLPLTSGQPRSTP